MKVQEESEKAGLKLNMWKTKIMASGPITSWQIDGENVETVLDFIFLGSKITADSDYSHEIEKMLAPWKNSYVKPRQCFKKQRHHFADKDHIIESYGFFSSHVRMWELDITLQSWTLKNWCFQTVVLKTLESPLDSKEIKPFNPKGNQPWVFIPRTDPEAEAPILWPPDGKSWLTGKASDAGKNWGQEGKGATWEWDAWMISLTQWTWVWANSER